MVDIVSTVFTLMNRFQLTFLDSWWFQGLVFTGYDDSFCACIKKANHLAEFG